MHLKKKERKKFGLHEERKIYVALDEKKDIQISKPIDNNPTTANSAAHNGQIESERLEEGVILKLPPCPFCRKEFKSGCETRRISHLKECGTSLGVSAEDLVKLHRLEVNFYLSWLFIVYRPKT